MIEWGHLSLYDFEVRVQDIDNPSVIKAKIKEIEETFDLIMIGKNKNKTDYHNIKFLDETKIRQIDHCDRMGSFNFP